MVCGKPVQNLSKSFKIQSGQSNAIASGAPVTIRTKDSSAFLPSLFLHITITENKGSFCFVVYGSLDISVRRRIFDTCWRFRGSDAALDALMIPPVADDTSHTANLGVKFWDTLRSFCNVLGMVLKYVLLFFALPWGPKVMTCSSSSNVYWTNARFRVSPSQSANAAKQYMHISNSPSQWLVGNLHVSDLKGHVLTCAWRTGV